MPPTNRSLHSIYVEQMAQHARFGHTLYEPPLSSDLTPGSVGYFDDSGSWNPILQLSQGAKAVQKAGYAELKEVLKRAKDDRNIVWGPKCSNGVKGVVVDIKAGSRCV